MRILTDYEQRFRDNITEEAIDLYGTAITFHDLDVEGSVPSNDLSALYGEPGADINWDTTAYYNVKVFIQKPETDISVSEGGNVEMKNMQVYFAKGYLEKNEVPAPKKGSIIEHPTFGFFDIIKVSREGYYTDDNLSHFVMYECDCERTTRFEPDRRTL